MIPKIIHHVWLGNKPMPLQFANYIADWKRVYHDFEFVLWTDSMVEQTNIIPEQFKELYYLNELSCVFKSDLLRFFVVAKYGGIYLDTDFECLKKLPELFFSFDFLGGVQTNNEVAIGFFASCPQSVVLIDTINCILPQIDAAKNSGVFSNDQLYKILGPPFFTQVCKSHFDSPNCFFFAPQHFYPYWWQEPHRRTENFIQTSPWAYAVHHWAKSWQV